ncbi:hypothetical protein AB1046_16720 [Promicromonospora sp. Populi]|uniref:hypothetical protein n=1 Tax=Promicromonospora sp. Populi TaxID=3239420 RepID=UPI0034E2D223
MSLHSISRTSLFRRGLVAVATATTLLGGGLVVAPAAQAASSLPVVDVHTRQGTTVTTSMFASGSTIDTDSDDSSSARFGYSVALKASGGTLLGAEAVVTVQKIDREPVRKRTIELKPTSTGMLTRGSIHFSGTIDPGTYRAGVEIFTVVLKPDGTRVRHLIDVNEANRVQFRRNAWIEGTISTQKTDGRPARINAIVLAREVADDGSPSEVRIRSGAAILSFDPDGAYGEKKATFVRDLKIGSDGKISTVVESRKGYWKVTYPGTSTNTDAVEWIAQGVPGGCGC